MNNRDIFPMGGGNGQFYEIARRPEQPNYKIEAKISLQKVLSKEDMAKLKQNLRRNDMDIVREQKKNITVTGFPPSYQYNAQSILAQVKKFDEGARVLA